MGAVEFEHLLGRAHAGTLLAVEPEIFGPEGLCLARAFVRGCVGVARVALAHLAIRDIAIDAIGCQRFQTAFTVVTGIGEERGVTGRAGHTDSRQVITHTVDHRLKQIVLLRGSVRLRLHNHLVLAIDGRHADIALQHASTS